jgi:NADPH2 dehydrogenase
VDAVHAKGSYIYLQVWAAGRGASPEVLESEGPYPYVSASDIPLSGSSVSPRALTIEGALLYTIIITINKKESLIIS